MIETSFSVPVYSSLRRVHVLCNCTLLARVQHGVASIPDVLGCNGVWNSQHDSSQWT